MQRCILLILICSISSFAQAKRIAIKPKPTPSPPCSLSKADKISLRGFLLGQDKSDLSKIRFFDEEYRKALAEDFSARAKFGWVLVGSTDLFYRDGQGRKVFDEKFEDVGFYLHFLDDKVVYVGIEYVEYEPDNLDEFIQQVAGTTPIPKSVWRKVDKYRAVAKCDGIDLSIWTGRRVDRPEYLSYPMLSLNDTNADLELTRREQEYKKGVKEAKAEAERKERERKKTFKP